MHADAIAFHHYYYYLRADDDVKWGETVHPFSFIFVYRFLIDRRQHHSSSIRVIFKWSSSHLMNEIEIKLQAHSNWLEMIAMQAVTSSVNLQIDSLTTSSPFLLKYLQKYFLFH
jgi:hypothetical protein